MVQPSGHRSDAANEPLWDSERLVSDAVGRLMVFWGFKRNMGRVWTVLFLSDEPLTSKQLQQRLQLSSGAVSMTLSELSRWGVVHKQWMQGERRDYFVAEANLWKMISRVLRERERGEVDDAIDAFECALEALEHRTVGSSSEARRVATQRERIGRLLELAKLGRSMIDALIHSARMDATWLARFRLGRSEPPSR